MVALRFGLDDILLVARARALPAAVGRAASLFWRDLSHAARGAPAPRARSLGPIFVKFGQMLSTRRDLLPHRHRRRAREAAGPRAAVPGRGRSIATLERCYGRPVDEVFAHVRPRAGRQRVGRAGAFRGAARRHAGRGEGAAARHRRRDRARPRADAHRRRRSSSACRPTASACGRARSSPSSRRRSATSSTSRARRPTARSCAAISGTRRCCSCPRSTGTTRRRK